MGAISRFGRPCESVRPLRELHPAALRALYDSLPSQGPLVLGVSGGIDSMVLWDLVAAANLPHSVVHVNYRWRGEESDGDEALVRQMAAKRDVDLHVLQAPEPPDSGNRQEWARDIRRQYFLETAQAIGAAWVLLAHHRDDQAETIVQRILRGTGPLGLQGMRVLDPPYWRPLLGLGREDLSKYQEGYNVAFREDGSNVSQAYTRNRIRHRLLPFLEDEEPGLRRHLVKLAADTQALAGFLEYAQQKWLQVHLLRRLGRQSLSIAALTDCDGVAYLLHAWLTPYEYAPPTIRALERALEESNGFGHFGNRSGTVVVERTRDRLVLGPAEAPPPAERSMGSGEWSHGYYHFRGSPGTSEQVKIRPVQEDDHLPLTSGGSQSVRKYLRGLGFSRAERQQVMVVHVFNRIVWIPGLWTAEIDAPLHRYMECELLSID